MRSSPFCTRASRASFANDSAVTYGGWALPSQSLLCLAAFCSWLRTNAARASPVCCAVCDDLWGRADALRLNTTWNILAGRIVSGIVRVAHLLLAVIAKTTTGAERGEMIGNWYAAGMLGMVFAPAVAALSGVFPTPKEGSMLSVNAYNAPALSSLLLHLVAVYIVQRWVHDPPEHEAEGAATPLAGVSSLKAQEPERNTASNVHNAGPPCGCYILIACQFLMVRNKRTETFVVPLFGHRFGSPAWVSGLVFAGIGLVVLIAAMTSGVLNGKCKFSERKIEAIGLVIFVLGCVMSFDWSAFFAVSRAGLIAFEAGSTIFVAFGFTFAFTMQPSLYSKLIINHDGGRPFPKWGTTWQG